MAETLEASRKLAEARALRARWLTEAGEARRENTEQSRRLWWTLMRGLRHLPGIPHQGREHWRHPEYVHRRDRPGN